MAWIAMKAGTEIPTTSRPKVELTFQPASTIVRVPRSGQLWPRGQGGNATS